MFEEPTVFVLGAGASYGDILVPKYHGEESPSRIPLIHQFFDSDWMFDQTSAVENEYSELIKHIREGWRIDDPFGTGKWQSLDLEDVFTSLAINDEFASEGTNQKAEAQLRLNALKEYIARSISRPSLRRFGKFTRQVVEYLKPQDSIITFNYDLLVDVEFLDPKPDPTKRHYELFADRLLERSLLSRETRLSFDRDQGLYLKLHGSLNWFVCNNARCPESSRMTIKPVPDEILGATQQRATPICDVCQRTLNPYLVTPLLNKPIMRDWISSVVWSNALSVLRSASKIVVIGYSFPATDFYSEWLFRTALWGNSTADIWVVNPLNDPHCGETDPEAKADYNLSRIAFFKRLANTISAPWNCDYFRFDQISEILASLEAA